MTAAERRAIDAVLDLDLGIESREAAEIVVTKVAATLCPSTLTDEEREALRPFVEFARNNLDEDYGGWKNGAAGRERISDWFGPSDFRALLTLAGKEQR